MKKYIIYSIMLALFILPTVSHAAPSLAWDAVTVNQEGNPFDPGMEVTSYNVYRCGPSTSNCSKTTGTKIATVPAPNTTYDLASESFPQAYTVTASNVIGESESAIPVKAVPPDKPKNLKVQ